MSLNIFAIKKYIDSWEMHPPKKVFRQSYLTSLGVSFLACRKECWTKFSQRFPQLCTGRKVYSVPGRTLNAMVTLFELGVSSPFRSNVQNCWPVLGDM